MSASFSSPSSAQLSALSYLSSTNIPDQLHGAIDSLFSSLIQSHIPLSQSPIDPLQYLSRHFSKLASAPRLASFTASECLDSHGHTAIRFQCRVLHCEEVHLLGESIFPNPDGKYTSLNSTPDSSSSLSLFSSAPEQFDFSPLNGIELVSFQAVEHEIESKLPLILHFPVSFTIGQAMAKLQNIDFLEFLIQQFYAEKGFNMGDNMTSNENGNGNGNGNVSSIVADPVRPVSSNPPVPAIPNFPLHFPASRSGAGGSLSNGFVLPDAGQDSRPRTGDSTAAMEEESFHVELADSGAENSNINGSSAPSAPAAPPAPKPSLFLPRPIISIFPFLTLIPRAAMPSQSQSPSSTTSSSIADSIRMITEITHSIQKVLKERKYPVENQNHGDIGEIPGIQEMIWIKEKDEKSKAETGMGMNTANTANTAAATASSTSTASKSKSKDKDDSTSTYTLHGIPQYFTIEDALKLVESVIQDSRYTLGQDIGLGLDFSSIFGVWNGNEREMEELAMNHASAASGNGNGGSNGNTPRTARSGDNAKKTGGKSAAAPLSTSGSATVQSPLQSPSSRASSDSALSPSTTSSPSPPRWLSYRNGKYEFTPDYYPSKTKPKPYTSTEWIQYLLKLRKEHSGLICYEYPFHFTDHDGYMKFNELLLHQYPSIILLAPWNHIDKRLLKCNCMGIVWNGMIGTLGKWFHTLDKVDRKGFYRDTNGAATAAGLQSPLPSSTRSKPKSNSSGISSSKSSTTSEPISMYSDSPIINAPLIYYSSFKDHTDSSSIAVSCALAILFQAHYIKCGGLSRGERVERMNQLIRYEQWLIQRGWYKDSNTEFQRMILGNHNGDENHHGGVGKKSGANNSKSNTIKEEKEKKKVVKPKENTTGTVAAAAAAAAAVTEDKPKIEREKE